MRAAGNKRKTQVKKADNATIYIGIIGFVLMSIYLFALIYSFMDNKSIAVEIVNYGNIEIPKVYKGIIVRDEQLVLSESDGNITYYSAEGERVKKNSVVCTVKNNSKTDVLEEEIKKYDSRILKVQSARSDISLYQNDILARNKNIEKLVSDYMTSSDETRLSNLYNFKEQLKSEIGLRSQILLMENRGSLIALMEEKSVYQQQLSDNVNIVSTPVSGIVSFCIDGFEEAYSIDNMFTLRDEQTSMEIKKNEKKEYINSGEALFKVIKSDEWYIVSYMPPKAVKSWSEGDNKSVVVNGNAIDMKVYKIINYSSESLVVFSADKGMLDLISERSIEFEVETQNYEGLKIPNTALVETTFLKIPVLYVTESMGETCIIKSQDVGNILINIEVEFTDDTEEYVYVRQDFNKLKLGDILIEPNNQTPGQYEISQVATSKGVYVVNNGIAELKAVEIIGENDTYSIVKASKKRGLKAYDRIISDAKSIKENQIIY